MYFHNFCIHILFILFREVFSINVLLYIIYIIIIIINIIITKIDVKKYNDGNKIILSR